MDFDPQRKGSFVSGSGWLCQISPKSVQNCDRESTDRQTDRHIHTQRSHSDLIICPMLCYSNGTDNNTVTSRLGSETKGHAKPDKPFMALLTLVE